jgi:hypothetical protein
MIGHPYLSTFLVLVISKSCSAEEYQYIKLQSLESEDNTKFCIGELEVYDSYRQISLIDYGSCSSSSTDTESDCAYAFQGNGDAELGFCSDPASSLNYAGLELDGAVGSLVLYMTPGDDVTKFKITALEGSADTAPTSFQLYGSNGGGDWTLLYEDSGLSWTDSETKTFYTEGVCDAQNRWGTGDNDFDETCQGRSYLACTGAYGSLCEWKEESYFQTCLDILLDGTTQSGVYEIYVEDTEEFIEVYCDMSIGGWTRVINVPGTEMQDAIFAEGSDSIGDNFLTGDDDLYKLTDATINTIMGDDPTIQYRCGSVDYFVTRASGWVTAIDQDGWLVDRDMDGTPDCDASRVGYLFSDYLEDNVNPVEGASIEICDSAGHTNFGYYEGSEVGCYNSEDDWGNRAHIYVRGLSTDTLVIESCADLEPSDWTGIYATNYGALYCNQELEGGDITGGWTLLMKTTTSGNLLQYQADYWTISNTLNGDSLFVYPINFMPQQAKLESFNGDHAGYRIQFNEYLAYWPDFTTSDLNTWYIGIFESMTALEFFQTPRTLAQDALSTSDFNNDYFSSENTWGKSGIAYSGGDDNTGVRWGYVFADSDSGEQVMALGGIGLDTMNFPDGISAGDTTMSGVSSVGTYSSDGAQTSYAVELYGRVYTGPTYESCTSLSVDETGSGIFYTPDVKAIFCDNDMMDGGWTLLFKTIGSGTEVTYTSDYISQGDSLTQDPSILSVNTEIEDAVLWTYASVDVDQLLFYYPDSETTFMTDAFSTAMTAQEFLSNDDTYRNDAPLDSEAVIVFGRQYYDGGVCARSTILDCTQKYFASPAPSPMHLSSYSSNSYTAVGADCNTLNVISITDDGYVSSGSVGASISACGAICDSDDACAGFELSRTTCTLVGDVSAAQLSNNENSNPAVTGGNICYSKIDMLYTTAPPPMWDELPKTVYLGDTYDGWGMWDDDATESWQYCADAAIATSCDAMSLDECLAMCESDAVDAEFCSYGDYASFEVGVAGGSECCYATATCEALTTSTEAKAAHYAIYQRLYEQTSMYRQCQESSDCNDGYYCAAYLLQADPGSASAELFLGTDVADTMVMCLPCVDATNITCTEWGDAIDSCDSCLAYPNAASMPIIERECGLDQYVNSVTGDCEPCTTGCAEGYYMTGDRCLGTETEDTVTCIECTTSCGLGKYMTGTCSGSGYEDAVSCTSCTSSCDEGFFLDYSEVTEAISCIGDGRETPVCSECTSRCNSGFYLDGTCDGTGTSNEVTCNECSNTCQDGQYIASTCSGTGTYDDTTCVDCKSECDSDEYLVGECDGSQSFDSIYCSKCTMICAEGQYFSARCDGTTTEDPLTCFDCTTECEEGYFMQGQCDGTTDTDNAICVSCDDCTTDVLQSDGFNCEATCLGSIIAAVVSESDEQTNEVTSVFSFIGAGNGNAVTSSYSIVASGIVNVASGYASVIGGGAYNLIADGADYSIIMGGEANTITGTYGVIGAGTNNRVLGEYNVIGGGNENTCDGSYNIINAGEENIIDSDSKQSVIAGGQYNTISGKYSTILGGKDNFVEGNYGLVLGGNQNHIIGSSNFATIAGGQKNTVEGKMSLSVGSKAETRADYSATFGFQKDVCETRAERVVNFCADEVAINGEPVLTLFVSRRRELGEEESESLKALSEVVFKQEEELAQLDAELEDMISEIDALMTTHSQ